MFKILVLAAALAAVPFMARAGHPHHGGGHGHGAPAPLLAAGIPAFLALGGGAAMARLVRRRGKRDAA